MDFDEDSEQMVYMLCFKKLGSLKVVNKQAQQFTPGRKKLIVLK